MISSTCQFAVTKGEEAPQLSPVGRVCGVAHKECNWQVPYKVRAVIDEVSRCTVSCCWWWWWRFLQAKITHDMHPMLTQVVEVRCYELFRVL